jgi:hypothetical protein
MSREQAEKEQDSFRDDITIYSAEGHWGEVIFAKSPLHLGSNVLIENHIGRGFHDAGWNCAGVSMAAPC